MVPMPKAEGSYKLYHHCWCSGGRRKVESEVKERGFPPQDLSVMKKTAGQDINFASTAAVNCPEQLVACVPSRALEV